MSKFVSHKDEVLRALDAQMAAALLICGGTAERYAKEECPVDTGRLRASIGHATDETTAYIGTNVKYAPYVELGTGVFYGGGRQTPWSFETANGVHITRGMSGRHFLRQAVTDHVDEYKRIIINELKG